MTPPSGPLGVTPSVWANDQISRVERTLEGLALAPLTLVETERLERALVKAHARNLLRLDELAEASA